MMCDLLCLSCGQQVIPPSWYHVWGEPPHCAIGICCCQLELPVLWEGDILVDRNYDAEVARHQTYGYRAKNIMTISREDDQGRLFQIWRRE